MFITLARCKTFSADLLRPLDKDGTREVRFEKATAGGLLVRTCYPSFPLEGYARNSLGLGSAAYLVS